MKRKILILVVCISTLALLACGAQQSPAQTDTTASITSTATPTVTPTEAPTATPTPTETTTATPVPLPYAEENGFVIENILEYNDVPFVHYITAEDSNEEAVYPGFSTQAVGYSIGINSVTKKQAEMEGYTTYTVVYCTELGVKNILDLTKTNMAGPIAWSASVFDICDYYSGMAGIANLMDENGNGETVLNWQGNETKIFFSEQYDGDMGYSELVEESDTVVSTVFSSWENHTMVITVPDGYDGILLYIRRNGITGEGKEACDAANESGSKTQQLLADGDKAVDYCFVRLTDVAE